MSVPPPTSPADLAEHEAGALLWTPAAERAVERLVAAAREALEMDVAWLGELCGDDLVFRALAGPRAFLGLAPGDRIPLGSSYCGFLVDGRIGSVVSDVPAHPQLGGLRLTLAAGVGAYVGIPVRLGDGRLFGTLCCASRRRRAEVGERDLRMLRVLAGLVAGHVDELPREPERPEA
jgi:GAF domain-containing protein